MDALNEAPRQPELDDFIDQGMGITEALAAWHAAMVDYAQARKEFIARSAPSAVH